jgi:hypothetical protein
MNVHNVEVAFTNPRSNPSGCLDAETQSRNGTVIGNSNGPAAIAYPRRSSIGIIKWCEHINFMPVVMQSLC